MDNIYLRIIKSIEILNNLLFDMNVSFTYDKNKEIIDRIDVIRCYEKISEIHLRVENNEYKLERYIGLRSLILDVTPTASEGMIIGGLLFLELFYSKDMLIYNILLEREKLKKIIQEFQKENSLLRMKKNRFKKEIKLYPESEFILKNIKDDFESLKNKD